MTVKSSAVIVELEDKLFIVASWTLRRGALVASANNGDLSFFVIKLNLKKKRRNHEDYGVSMRLPGVEPGASGLGGSRSILLSYRRK